MPATLRCRLCSFRNSFGRLPEGVFETELSLICNREHLKNDALHHFELFFGCQSVHSGRLVEVDQTLDALVLMRLLTLRKIEHFHLRKYFTEELVKRLLVVLLLVLISDHVEFIVDCYGAIFEGEVCRYPQVARVNTWSVIFSKMFYIGNLVDDIMRVAEMLPDLSSWHPVTIVKHYICSQYLADCNQSFWPFTISLTFSFVFEVFARQTLCKRVLIESRDVFLEQNEGPI